MTPYIKEKMDALLLDVEREAKLNETFRCFNVLGDAFDGIRLTAEAIEAYRLALIEILNVDGQTETEGATSFDVTGGTIENTTDGLIAEAVAAERERCMDIASAAVFKFDGCFWHPAQVVSWIRSEILAPSGRVTQAMTDGGKRDIREYFSEQPRSGQKDSV